MYEYTIRIDTHLSEIGIEEINIIAEDDREAEQKALNFIKDKYSAEYRDSENRARQSRTRYKTLLNRAVKANR